MNKGLEYFLRAKDELEEVGAAGPHDLMRVAECGFIRDCAEMAARASLYRTESRWGLYHHRLDFPEMNDRDWFVHVNLKKGPDGRMVLFKRPVDEYVVPMSRAELTGYHDLRVSEPKSPLAAPTVHNGMAP
jgi:succinate dehydrogenase/fumarate reductase flavoprotein subunit